MEKGTNKKTFVSVGKIGLIALAGLALYKLLENSYKKELKTLVEAKEQENKDIESLGVSSERMRSQVFDCEREVDRNIVKAMYVGIEAKIEKNPDYADLVDIDKVLASQNIVHVTEERGYKGLKYLTLLLEIPDNAMEKKGNFAIPRIGDYYVAMKQLKEHLWSREVVYCKEPIGRMTAFLAYSYTDPKKEGNENVTTTVEIPRSIWSRWEDEHDGLVEFYEDVCKNGLSAIKKKGILRIMDIIPAVVAVITFILTEDMSNPMVLVDQWTLLMVAILVVDVVIGIFTKRSTKDVEDEKQNEQA